MKLSIVQRISIVAILLCGVLGPATAVGGVPFEITPLPYEYDALEPHISAKTLSYHYYWHHQGYVHNLNRLVAGTEWEGKSLPEIISDTAGKQDQQAIFNNAAQVWNHYFFWESMHPRGGGVPSGKLLHMIEESFGSYTNFKDQFSAEALAEFGSGWVWLIQNGDKLEIASTTDAETPIARNQHPLITLNLWEHAYYLDYQNRRRDFVKTFLDYLVNWEFAESRLQ